MTYAIEALESWITALGALTDSPDVALAYRDARTRFAIEVARQLTEATRVVRATRAPVVYGVWLNGHNMPVYIGQTMHAGRRLWDLPVGESHHLANTFPPEIWKRIVVVKWLDLARGDPNLETCFATASESMAASSSYTPEQAVGLGLEHLLQRDLRPLINARRRTRDGTWREVELADSRAIGAKLSSQVGPLYTRVLESWSVLSGDDAPSQPSVEHEFGSVVYPSLIWHSQFASAGP